MCGITGIFNFKNIISLDDKLVLRKMVDCLKHRGPDGEGFYESKHCLLGHARLAIIDLEKGAQPIFNEDKSIAVIYNGEIYNYKEIRKKLLGLGHRFITNSDTEIIVHAYEEWGQGSFKFFNGMFAISIYDIKANLVYLVRDRIGMKPIYYYHKEDFLIWASEIKAILLHPKIKRVLNPDTLVDFMTFQNTIDQKTFFKDIYKLQPGCFLKIQDGKVRLEKYWDLNFDSNTEFKNINDVVETYQKVFKESIRRHLVSDVEIASYLSGGFDSSSVAFFASRDLPYPLKTFTGFFAEKKKYDERDVVRLFERFSNTQNKEIQITADDFLKNIEKVIYSLDEPTLGSGALPQYIVAREVAKFAKVVLTGHGGDELFAGYQVYKAAYYKDLLKKNILQFLGKCWRNRADEVLKIIYFFLFPRLFKEIKYGLFILFNQQQRRKLFTSQFMCDLKGYSPLRNLENKYLDNKKFSHTERTLYLYLKTYLPTLFIQEDKIGMAHSLESRMPICDNEMVEFSAKVPSQYKLYNNELKYLTKATMRGFLPKDFYAHPKMGFPTPIAIWFKGQLKDYVYDILTSSKIKNREIFNPRYIRNLLDSHLRYSHDSLYDYVRANKIGNVK